MVRVAAASVFALAAGQPSCNQVDGDYPGCGLSKLTHAASVPISGKQFMYKYFNVQTPGDECDNDTCDCSSEGAPNIKQGRVFLTREVSPSGGPPPGNGFGLHLVSVPGHWTTGGLTVEEVEAHFTEKLGDMTTFDSFMDFTAILGTSSLQGYKDAFDKDGVKYFTGSWSDSKGNKYTSVIVRVTGSQLLLELVQQTSLVMSKGDLPPTQLEQRVPDSVLSQLENSLAGESFSDTTTDYVKSLGISRAASSAAMNKLEGFYVSGMGTTKTHDSTEGDVSKKCFLWPGASMNVCFTSRPDSATSGDFKVGDFEDMLNKVHKTIVDGHPFCPMDRWFDNHYAVDSQTVSGTQILSYINSENPFHTCGSSPMGGTGLKAVWDPTGLGVQLDTSTGLPNDCSSTDIPSFLKEQGTYNPACTVDTSKCGTSPTPSPTPTPSPSPVPTPTPVPPPTPGAHCDRCSELINQNCAHTDLKSCKSCASHHKAQWTPIGCTVSMCDNEITAACGGAVIV